MKKLEKLCITHRANYKMNIVRNKTDYLFQAVGNKIISLASRKFMSENKMANQYDVG